tara:strand:+ start:4163 stop:4612 length:450 start_codon:yes stop_codon:yes gene_type:complete
MSILSTKKTIKHIKLNLLTENEKFKYFYTLSILSSLSILENPISSTTNINKWSDTLYFIIVILGIYFCFHTNKKGDHSQFIERFLIISLPVILQHLMGLFFLLSSALVFFHLFKFSIPNLNQYFFIPHIITSSCFFSIKKSLENISLKS